MGLTIHYELRLPGETSDATAVHHLQRLHDYAATLGAKHMCPVFFFNGAQLSLPDEEWKPGTVAWLLHMCIELIRSFRDGVVNAIDDIDDKYLLTAAGFVVYPGEGSESVTLGLVRPLVTTQPEDLGPERQDKDDWKHWYWSGFCKTQYASRVSENHFLSCHRMVVNLLDKAKRIGFDVSVHDEGQYWETRDTELLLSEVRRSNIIMAHLAGALHDAISPEHNVEAEIFSHPEFEHLEMQRIEHRNADNSSDV